MAAIKQKLKSSVYFDDMLRLTKLQVEVNNGLEWSLKQENERWLRTSAH